MILSSILTFNFRNLFSYVLFFIWSKCRMPHRFWLHSPLISPLCLNLLLDWFLASLKLHLQLSEEWQKVLCSQGVRQRVEAVRVVPEMENSIPENLSSSPLVAWAQVGLTHLVRLLLLVLDHLVAGDAVLVPDDLHLVEADTLWHVVVLTTPAPEHVGISVQFPEKYTGLIWI